MSQDKDESRPLFDDKGEPTVRKLEDSDVEISVIVESLSYVFSSGIVGLTNVSFADCISDLASNVGYSSVEIGGVFVARCAGSIVGSLAFPIFSTYFGGVNTIIGCMIAYLCITAYTSFCNSLVFLYFLFFFSGMLGSSIDTAAMSLMRRLRGKQAGPWMSACIMAYSTAGVLSLLIQALTSSVVVQFELIAVMSAAVTLWLILEPHSPATLAHTATTAPPVAFANPNNTNNHPISDEEALLAMPHKTCLDHAHHFLVEYRVELVCATTLLAQMGASAAITAYLETYVDDDFSDDAAKNRAVSADMAPYVLMVFWIALVVSRFALIFIQPFLRTVRLLQEVNFACTVPCVVACACVLAFSANGVMLWICVAILGLCLGPGAGIVYDINNKLTVPHDVSTSILMVGINVGGGLSTYLVSALWQYTALGPAALFLTVLLLMLSSLVIWLV